MTTAKRAAATADAFLSTLPQFRSVYATYCAAYSRAGTALERLIEQRGRPHDYVVAQQQESGMQLAALLFRPVQRMCAYPLLFREALKCMTAGSDAHCHFKEAATSIEAMIELVNEDVRRVESRELAVMVLSEQLGGALGAHLVGDPACRLIASADVRKQRAAV